MDKLWACQNPWKKAKLVYTEILEIKLLDDHSETLKMSLWYAMMMLCHPMNTKFTLFYLVDCSQMMVCKSVESYTHAMISALIPFLQWQF